MDKFLKQAFINGFIAGVGSCLLLALFIFCLTQILL